MDAGDVLLMVEAGVPETVVLQTLRAETAPMHPTVPELVALKRAGASERLLVWVAHPKSPAAAWAESELTAAATEDVPHTMHGELVGLDCGDGVTLVLAPIPAGAFIMGSPVTERNRVNDETQHNVTISRPFYMGIHAVTQEQYRAVMGENPSKFQGRPDSGIRPVEQVTWYEAAEFCRRLSERTGWMVRLPTEAEWEYACRAGTATAYSFGDTIGQERANFGEMYVETVAVGCFPANAWGLHDMHGNVWEWCSDWIGGPYSAEGVIDPRGAATGELRATRGGSCLSEEKNCRSAARGGSEPDVQNDLGNLGFRVVLDGSAWEPEVALPEGVPPIDPGQGWLAIVNYHTAAGCSIRVDRVNRRLTFGGVDQPGATVLPAGAMYILALDAGDYALWGELDKPIPVRVLEARATTMALEPFEMDGFEGLGVSIYDDDGTDNPPLLSSGVLAARAKPQPVMAPVVIVQSPPPVVVLERYYVAQPRRSSWLPALAGFFLSREPDYRGPRHARPPTIQPRPFAPPAPNRNTVPTRPTALSPAVPARPVQPPVQAATPRPAAPSPTAPARPAQPLASTVRPPVHVTPVPPARPTAPATPPRLATPVATPVPVSQAPAAPAHPAQPPIQTTPARPPVSQVSAVPARLAQPPAQVTTPQPVAPMPATPARPAQPPIQTTPARPPVSQASAVPARPAQPPAQATPASTVRPPVHVTPAPPTRPTVQATPPRPAAPVPTATPRLAAPQTPTPPARPAQPSTRVEEPSRSAAPARPPQQPARADTPSRPAASGKTSRDAGPSVTEEEDETTVPGQRGRGR